MSVQGSRVICPLPLDDPVIAGEVHALQRTSYAVEQSLTGIAEIPALHESVAALVVCGETFVGVRDAHASLLGLVSYRLERRLLDIHRLAVAPDAFRQGVGRALVAAILTLPHDRAIVATGLGNTPALALYRAAGFHLLGERAVSSDVTVWELERIHARSALDPPRGGVDSDVYPCTDWYSHAPCP